MEPAPFHRAGYSRSAEPASAAELKVPAQRGPSRAGAGGGLTRDAGGAAYSLRRPWIPRRTGRGGGTALETTTEKDSFSVVADGEEMDAVRHGRRVRAILAADVEREHTEQGLLPLPAKPPKLCEVYDDEREEEPYYPENHRSGRDASAVVGIGVCDELTGSP
jgi:hypothetical protein